MREKHGHLQLCNPLSRLAHDRLIHKSLLHCGTGQVNYLLRVVFGVRSDNSLAVLQLDGCADT